MTQSEEDGFYSRKEFLNTFSISNSEFYRQVKAGRLRIHKIGRASRIGKADAKAWAASLPTFGGEVRP